MLAAPASVYSLVISWLVAATGARSPATARTPASATAGNNPPGALGEEERDLAGGVVALAIITLNRGIAILDRTNGVKFVTTIVAYILI